LKLPPKTAPYDRAWLTNCWGQTDGTEYVSFKAVNLLHKYGAAGWDALQTRGYDLIVTDNKMPRMTGIEMIGRLRSAKMAVPVIMATRQLPVFEFASRPWLKPDAALERPFSNDDLLETVKKVLGQADRGPGEHSRVFDAHHL